MRRFFISTSDINGSTATIRGAEARHLSQVLRLDVGQLVELFNGEGTVYQAKIGTIAKSAVEAEITSCQEVTEELPQLSLGQALLKGKKMDLVFQKATELGLHSVQPIITQRSVRKQATDNQLTRWQRIAFESCKQCGRPTLMSCEPSARFRDAIGQSAAYDTKLIFWEEEHDTCLHDFTNHHWGDSVFILIGPEGGFSREEITFATSQGFTTVSLGKRILRAETAAISAISIVQFLLENLKAPITEGDK